MQPPKLYPEPEFPFIAVYIAALKDLLDALELTIILMILTKILSFLMAVFLFVWTNAQLMRGGVRGKTREQAWTRYVATAVIELIPFIGIFPATSLYVIRTHYAVRLSVKESNEEIKKAWQAEQARLAATAQAQAAQRSDEEAQSLAILNMAQQQAANG